MYTLLHNFKNDYGRLKLKHHKPFTINLQLKSKYYVIIQI